jgi:hypothetical protein
LEPTGIFSRAIYSQKYKLTPTAHVFDLIVPIIASLGKKDAMDEVLSTMIAVCMRAAEGSHDPLCGSLVKSSTHS